MLPEDRPFARERGSQASDKLAPGLWSGVGYASFLVVGWTAMFPLTPVTVGTLLLALAAAAVYGLGMTFAFRSWLRLRRNPGED